MLVEGKMDMSGCIILIKAILTLCMRSKRSKSGNYEYDNGRLTITQILMHKAKSSALLSMSGIQLRYSKEHLAPFFFQGCQIM